MKNMMKPERSPRRILRSQRGESLMECIASLLILSLLLLTVALMVQTSLRITTDAATTADTMQNDVFNPAISGDYDENSNPGTFKITPETGTDFTHDIHYYDNDGVIAFKPDLGGGTP